MAGERDTSVQAVQVRDFISDIIGSYEQVPMELPRYLLAVLGPAVVFFLLFVTGIIALPLPLLVHIPVFLLGMPLLGGAILYPWLLVEQTHRSLENQLHLLVTHMTVLSTTNIDHVTAFRTLAREEEYGELTTEMNRIIQLVDAWNQSFNDTCQRRAREVPSKSLADFLGRFTYPINAGRSIDDFLLSEQSVMIQKYITVYESALENLEVTKDLYLSMILLITFVIINAIVLPILTGTDATVTIGAVIILFVFVQLSFCFVIRMMSPHDPLWYHQREYRTKANRQIDITLYSTVGLFITMVLVLALDTFNLTPVDTTVRPITIELPTPFLILTPLTSLMVPGIVARRHEKRTGERGEECPGFIRTLEVSETAKQSATTAVLKTLKTRDFGILSREIARLYTQLRMRLNPDRSWFFFTAETNSYLVQKFSEMYNVGRSTGSEPKLLGELISRNMGEIIKLRHQREQSTVTLIGVLYGITASTSFAFFIGLEVVEILASFSTEMDPDGLQFGMLIYAGVYNVPFIGYMLTLIILFSASLSSLVIWMADGGHKAGTYLHFVMLVWVGSLMAVATSPLAGTPTSV